MFDNNICNITSESYDSINYLLNSELRMHILKILSYSNSSVEDIKNKLNKQESNILRTLKELDELKLVKVNDKTYSLTSSGYLAYRNVKIFIDNWNYINEHKKEFNEHTMENIPLYFSKYLYLWKSSELIQSDYVYYNRTIDVYRKRIMNSKNLRIILPIYSKYHLESILNTIVETNGYLELVTSRNILNAIKKSNFIETFEKLRADGSINVWLSNDDVHKMFFTINDNSAFLSFFYLDDSYDDYSMLIDNDKSHMDVHLNLFDRYKSSFNKI